MTSNSIVFPLRQSDVIDDPPTAVLRSGTRLLTQAVEVGAEAFLAVMKGTRLADGRERLVRHGHGPERSVQTGIGPVEMRRGKLRDRSAGTGTKGDRDRFTSALLSRWSRRTCGLKRARPHLRKTRVALFGFRGGEVGAGKQG